MRFVLILLASATLIASVSASAQETTPATPAQAQAPSFAQFRALPQASRAALTSWLQRDCTIGVAEDEAARLRTAPGVNSGVLIEAYNQGPPPELERELTDVFDRSFTARNATLAQEGASLMSREDLAALQSVTREAYVMRRLGQARQNYRTNAVLALGAVGGAGAVETLNQIAADQASPMRQAAQASLAQLRAAPR